MYKKRAPKHKRLGMNKHEKFVAAVAIALLIVLLWRSMPNPPKVYPGGRRMHHGPLGAALVGLGVVLKRPYVATFGAILALDDIEDLPHWFDFERRSPQGIGYV